MNTALKLAFLSVLVFGPARGSEIEIGTGLVCNTQKQVEEFVAFSEADPQTAITAVNDEERNPTACGVANLAFVRGRPALTVRTRDATFQIANILVVGLIDGNCMQSVTPIVQFALFKVDERRA
jgi:hypothetical protein